MDIPVIFILFGVVVAAPFLVSVAITSKTGRFWQGWLLTMAVAILVAIITAIVVAMGITGFNAKAFVYTLMLSIAPIGIACISSIVGAYVGSLLSKNKA